ncbi:hypothetical protein HPB48_026308 [Haemaphysalis longicornis]|uniref:Uncharacterized protein n=1 Tax=Haemaphysalis longicornis TaxID=44386 RepID=A0A9J6H9B0_HAELO|nr:hypothetical protein HPB48_026308 [Haemaphysalis longicornis]
MLYYRCVTSVCNQTNIPVQTYEPAPDNASRGVLHGLTGCDSSELHKRLQYETHRILAVRPMGRNGTVLVTFQGPTLPTAMTFGLGQVKVHPYKPRVPVCAVCHDIGHRKDVCPNTHRKRCTKCGGRQHDSSSDLDTCSLTVTPVCKNCRGKHLATDPRCPARQAATQNLRAKLLQVTTQASLTTGVLGAPIDLNLKKMPRRSRQRSSSNMGSIDDSAMPDHVAPGITNACLRKNPSPTESPLSLPFDKNDHNFPPLLGQDTVLSSAAHISGKKVNTGESPWEASNASKSPEGTGRSFSPNPNPAYTKPVEILIHHLERIEESQKQLTATINAIIDQQSQLLQLTKNLLRRYNGR